jgi:acyl-CoA synthetase (NDP forming)/GNAT superfamily N-acetyltransferase
MPVVTAYPDAFESDVLLADGGVVRLRPITPKDAPLEVDFIRRVGPQSMYQRFFHAKKDLTPEELRYFTTVDYDERMAFVALHGEEMVAVGRYDVSSGKTAPDGGRVAEVAFLVQDDHQGRGIGSILLQHLTAYARSRGITEFEAFVLADNFGMMRLFRSSGYTVSRSLDEDVYRIEFPLDYSPEARAADWEHERIAITASMAPLFIPRKVAVIGADQAADAPGGKLLRNILMGGYTGIVYPVNPERSFVHSVKCHPDVTDIPDVVDLALIALPPTETIEAIEACGRKGVRAVVVCGESGDRAWSRSLTRAARRAGIRLLGPDSVGVAATRQEVGLQAHTGASAVAAGTIGLAAQSGALGLAILADVTRIGCGLSSFLSLGEACDVTASDALVYWEGDPFTNVILLYVESFGSSRQFGRLARRVGRAKPIVAVKGGRAGIAGGREIAVETLFRSSGVIRAETLPEMLDIARLLANQPLPTGRRVAVLSDAGGPATLAAGALEANGLELPPLPGFRTNPVVTTRAELAELIPRMAGAVDAVMVVESPGAVEEVLPSVDALPVLAVRMGMAVPHHRDVPTYHYPEQAARTLAAAVRYSEWRSGPEGAVPEYPEADRAGAAAVVRRAVAAGRTALDDDELAEVLGAYGIGCGTLEGTLVGQVTVQMNEDAVFGPLISFRMSGPIPQLAGDISCRINPLTDLDAAGMVGEVRSAAVLWGYGGSERGHLAGVTDLILRLSFLVEDLPEIEAINLDPVSVGTGSVVVDRAVAAVRGVEGRLVSSRKDVPGRLA